MIFYYDSILGLQYFNNPIPVFNISVPVYKELDTKKLIELFKETGMLIVDSSDTVFHDSYPLIMSNMKLKSTL